MHLVHKNPDPPALVSQARVMLCVPWPLYLRLASAFSQFPRAVLVLALENEISFTWLEVYSNHFPLLVPHELTRQWEQRACLVSIWTLLKPQFTQVSCELACSSERMAWSSSTRACGVFSFSQVICLFSSKWGLKDGGNRKWEDWLMSPQFPWNGLPIRVEM